MRRYHSHFSRREAEIWPLVGQVEPQQKVFAVPPISVGGGLDDIHPMRRGGVKSFVDDLVLGRGVVPSRAATSLRSVETQPLTRRFVRIRRATISVPGRGESQQRAKHFAKRQPGESRAGRAFDRDLATITRVKSSVVS